MYSIGVFLGNGNWNLWNVSNLSYWHVLSDPFVLVLADFNRDDHLDIVVVNTFSGKYRYFSWNWRWKLLCTQVTYSTGYGSTPYFVTVANLNHDNNYDHCC